MDGPEHALTGAVLGLGLSLFLFNEWWAFPLAGILGAFFGILPDIDIQTSEIRTWEITSFILPGIIMLIIFEKTNSLILTFIGMILSWLIWSIAVSTRGILKHRGLTHSLATLVLVSVATLFLAGKPWQILITCCWASHLILDKPKKINLGLPNPLKLIQK